MNGHARVLAVGEAELTRQVVERAAASPAYRFVCATSDSDALGLLEAGPADAVALVARTAGDSVVEFLLLLLERWPGLPVIVVLDDAPPPEITRLLEDGASDVLSIGVTGAELVLALDKATAHAERGRVLPPPPNAKSEYLFGNSPAMRAARDLLDRAATSRATVLIRGESGTGKELAARTLHQQSDRRQKPFVKIDCASMPEGLLESELFGYEKGAFTGAAARKPGRVELAEGGTLFLDEIGELGASVQAKLLQLLQDKRIHRLGATQSVSVDVRVVAATHRELEAMIERREFRQDLFYRLNVLPIWLPPLRARRDDIDFLTRHFWQVACAENGKSVSLSDEAHAFLRRQRWPGNVRQLQNFVERLVVLSSAERVTVNEAMAELSREVRFLTEPVSAADASSPMDGAALPLAEEVRIAERRALERALERTDGNRSRAAKLLGVSRSNLYAKLEEHGLL